MTPTDAVVYWVSRVDWMIVAFYLLGIAIVWSLWTADRGNRSAFKLIHFVTDGYGRGDKYSLAYVVIMLFSVWGLGYLIAHDKLTEWFFTVLVGAFILGALGGSAARLTALLKDKKPPAADSGDDPADHGEPLMQRETRVTETVHVPQPDATPKAAAKSKGKP